MKNIAIAILLLSTIQVKAQHKTVYLAYHFQLSRWNENTEKVETVGDGTSCERLVFLLKNSIKLVNKNDASKTNVYYITSSGKKIVESNSSRVEYAAYDNDGVYCEIHLLTDFDNGRQALLILYLQEPSHMIRYLIKPYDE